MSSDGRDKDTELLASGYDGDISDTDSEASTVIAARSTTSDQPILTNDEQQESQHNDYGNGTICIGCNVRDAGPGVVNDEEARIGTIWIGCSVCDMGFDGYQVILVPNENHPTVEYVEKVGPLHAKYSEASTNNGENGEAKACE